MIWTTPARNDLKHIHAFIADGSAFYAKKVAQDIQEKTEILNELPNIGKVVPELATAQVRELHIYSYRILYEVIDSDCYILAVIHQRQDISESELL